GGGSGFNNEQPIAYGLPSLASRAVFALIGLGSVAFAARQIERRARGVTSARATRRAQRGTAPTVRAVEVVPETRLQPAASSPVGLLSGIRSVGRAELRELAR